MDEYDEEVWRHGMNAKYFPYINAMDAVRPGMIKRGRGAIVNIIGMGGKLASPTHLAGGAANAALMLVTAGMAHALGRNGIRVNTINPGPFFTDRVKRALQVDSKVQGIDEDEVLKRNQARIPLGRYGRPEEVAHELPVFLKGGLEILPSEGPAVEDVLVPSRGEGIIGCQGRQSRGEPRDPPGSWGPEIACKNQRGCQQR